MAVQRATGRGVHISAVPPTGYDRGDDSRLVKNVTASAVELIFDGRARRPRLSWGSIIDQLESSPHRPAWTPMSARNFTRGERCQPELLELQEQARALRGDESNPTSWGDVAALLAESPHRPHWTVSTVARIVQNSVYRGAIHYQGDVHNILIEGSHPAIVDSTTWELANEPLEGATSTKGRFSGLVASRGIATCAGCSNTMKIGATTPKYGPYAGQRVALLNCTGRSGAGDCPARASITARLLDEHLLGLFVAHLRESPDRWKSSLIISNADLEDARLERERLLTSYRDYARLATKAMVGDEAIWTANLSEAKADWQRAHAVYEQRKAESELAGLGQLSGGDLLEMISAGELTPDELNELFTAAFSSVVVSKPPRRTNGALISERVNYAWR